MKVCYHCKTPYERDGKPGRQEYCSHCDRDLHCCLNCVFHDESYSDECRENQAERVIDKEKSNFCDYFQFKDGDASGKSSDNSTRKNFDDLFS